MRKRDQAHGAFRTGRLRILAFVLVFCMAGFCGCGDEKENKETEPETVAVHAGEHLLHLAENGTVTDQIVEEFKDEKYDQEQFRADVEAELKEVNAKGNVASLQSLELKDGLMTVVLQFWSPEAYAAYNQKYVTGEEVILFQGNIEGAANQGYDMDAAFVKAGTNETVSPDTIKADAELKVIITNQACKLTADYPIVYVSEGVTMDTGAAVTKADSVNYIFYKNDTSVKEDEES